jgi:DNA-nicking Smr family endonuclease
MVIDLHGLGLAGAHSLLETRLGEALARAHRLILLVTGKLPHPDRRPEGRGAIRAAVPDWLSSSSYASAIAAVRSAHPRHGGAGALYIVLRRPRDRHRQNS